MIDYNHKEIKNRFNKYKKTNKEGDINKHETFQHKIFIEINQNIQLKLILQILIF